MDPNPSPLSSFTVGKHSLLILCCWDHIVFWLYPCFGFVHWLENDWDSTESTHWVHPRKRKPCFVRQQKRGRFANLIPFSPSAGIQLMQSILQMKMSCIWFHAHRMLELRLAHHRSTVWAILPSVAGFFLQTPVHIWWETALKPASALTLQEQLSPSSYLQTKTCLPPPIKALGESNSPLKEINPPKPFEML